MKDIKLKKTAAPHKAGFQNPHNAQEGQGRYLEEAIGREAVSYTHLTLPTNREV